MNTKSNQPYKEISYRLQKIATDAIDTPIDFLVNPTVFHQQPNHISNTFKMAMEAYFYDKIKGEKILIFYPPRQSFWDYILRRKPKPYKVKVIAKDVLKNPPVFGHDVIQMYEIKKDGKAIKTCSKLDMTREQKINRAKTIRGKISQLVGEDSNGDWALRKADDAIDEYIKDIQKQ